MMLILSVIPPISKEHYIDINVATIKMNNIKVVLISGFSFKLVSALNYSLPFHCQKCRKTN